MVEALKKLDKKFLIVASIIIFLPILLIIFLAIIRGCDGGKTTYSNYEVKMKTAAEKYLNEKKMLPTDEGENVTVKLSKLIEKGYIKDTGKSLDDDTCDGSVLVRRNGASIENNNGGYLSYLVSLKCDKYETTTINSKLKKSAVISDSGLYKTDDGYIFKGNKVKNYIDFFGNIYRIASIDNDGLLKLIKVEPELISRIWDNKYNIEVNHSYGKSIYKDSAILTYLLDDYTNTKKFPTKSKEHIVAHDVCIGKRGSDDVSISKEKDCSEILEKQLISLINVSDYALASIDENCDSIISRSCGNYNYLNSVTASSWTLNSTLDNSYEVFYILDGIANLQNANSYNEYNIVIYIDGNELYTEGNGSITKPYIIK